MESFTEHADSIFAAFVGFGFGLIILLGLLAWLINVACMMIGAKLANIDDRGFGKAFLASLLIALLGGGLVGLLSAVHPIAGLIGMIAVPALFIQWVYSCGFGKAVLAYIINLIASFVLIIGLFATVVLGLGMTAKQLDDADSSSEEKSDNIENVQTAEESE